MDDIGVRGVKKAKAKKGKVGRPEGRRPVLALRLDQPIYDQLTAAAAAAGRTVAEETARRLTQSFKNEVAMGDAEMQRMAIWMASTFSFTGHRTALANGHSDWTPRDWLGDQDCYRSALITLTAALIDGLPKPTPKEKELVLLSLQGRVASGLVQSGELKIKFEDENDGTR